jgi:uncharacterized protein
MIHRPAASALILPLTLALLVGCATVSDRGETSMSTEPAPHVHHAIDYIEIGVTDMAAAQAFYTSAFGWAFTDYGPGYAGIQGLGREVGGLRLDEAVATGGPLVILFSADLQASVAAVRAAGGTVTVEPFEFPGGRRFEFLDPSGNHLAVWAEK